MYLRSIVTGNAIEHWNALLLCTHLMVDVHSLRDLEISTVLYTSALQITPLSEVFSLWLKALRLVSWRLTVELLIRLNDARQSSTCERQKRKGCLSTTNTARRPTRVCKSRLAVQVL